MTETFRDELDFDDLQSPNKKTKEELQNDNIRLKQALVNANIKIRDYEETIKQDNFKELGHSNLTKDDLFNIMHNSTFIIDTD